MSREYPHDAWTPIGATLNTRYFLAGEDVIVVAPDHGLRDDAASATVNIQFQKDYARAHGRRCAVIVILDSLAAQDSGARRIYATEMDPSLFYGAALIVNSALGRAIGSFFLGLSRPPVPTQLFDTIDGALAWLATVRPAVQR